MYSFYAGDSKHMKYRCTSRALIHLCSELLLLCIGWSCLSQAETVSISLSPDTIQMGAFYDGSAIKIQGSVPPDSGIIVVIRGDKKDEIFNKKGRVGPIWINTDKVHVAAVPSLFLSFASSDISSLLNRETIDSYELDDSSIASHLVCRIHCKCSSQQSGKASVDSCKGIEPRSAVSSSHSKKFHRP